MGTTGEAWALRAHAMATRGAEAQSCWRLWPASAMELSESAAIVSNTNRTRTLTEYSRALMALGSECDSTLPTLRCTKRSPACKPVTASATTRESEHPIHRYSGFWLSAQREKYSGSFRWTLLTQRLKESGDS